MVQRQCTARHKTASKVSTKKASKPRIRKLRKRFSSSKQKRLMAEIDVYVLDKTLPAYKYSRCYQLTHEEMEHIRTHKDPTVRKFYAAYAPLRSKIDRLLRKVMAGRKTRCPICARSVNPQNVTIRLPEVRWLIALCSLQDKQRRKRPDRDPLPEAQADIVKEMVRIFGPNAKPPNGNYAFTRFFGVAKSEQISAESGRGNGAWTITKKGRRWLRGKLAIPKYCVRYNNEGIHLHGEDWTVQDACKKWKFSLSEVLGNIPDAGLRKVVKKLRAKEETGKFKRTNYGVKKPKP